jgi:hypothetical protein
MPLKKMGELTGLLLSQNVITADNLVLGKAFDKITIEMLHSMKEAGIKGISTFSTHEDDKYFIKMLAEYPHVYTNFECHRIRANEDPSYLEGKILYRNAIFENEKLECIIIAEAGEIITKPMIARLVNAGVKSVYAADVVSKERTEKPRIAPSALSKTEHMPAKKKITKTQTEDVCEKQPRGRPVEHKEEWSKITVVLLDKQIHWLDQLASNIRLNTKTAISRTELIRAIIASVEESGVDLSQLKNEAEIKSRLFSAPG